MQTTLHAGTSTTSSMTEAWHEFRLVDQLNPVFHARLARGWPVREGNVVFMASHLAR